MREESIFNGALGIQSAAERAAFLDAACAGDPELRLRIETLLKAHHQSGDLLDPPEGGEPSASVPPAVLTSDRGAAGSPSGPPRPRDAVRPEDVRDRGKRNG